MSQTKRKFIEDNAVNGSKFRLDNNEMLRGRNAANTADINIGKITSGDKFEFQTLPEAESSLPIPSALKQFATIEYINNFVDGKGDAKDSVHLLADSNTPLTGATPLVIDGVTVVNGMRIGLVGNTAGLENGIYDAAITGPTYTLTRSSDANTSAEVTEGMYFKVSQGTAYQGFEAQLTTPDPIVLDTTALSFIIQPTVLAQIAGDMLSKLGNVWAVDLASLGGLESSNPGNSAGQLRVKTDTAALEKDKTTRIDPVQGSVVAKKSKKQIFVLNASDITNQYLDLSEVAADSSICFGIAGAGAQIEGTDYTVNYTGGAGSKTRVTFAGGLATAGVSALAAGDQVEISYMSF